MIPGIWTEEKEQGVKNEILTYDDFNSPCLQY